MSVTSITTAKIIFDGVKINTQKKLFRAGNQNSCKSVEGMFVSFKVLIYH